MSGKMKWHRKRERLSAVDEERRRDALFKSAVQQLKQSREQTRLRVVELSPVHWAVVDQTGQIKQDGFATQAQAWGWLDKHDMRPTTWTNSNRHHWGR